MKSEKEILDMSIDELLDYIEFILDKDDTTDTELIFCISLLDEYRNKIKLK